MEIVSILEDNRIGAINVLLEFNIGEYLPIAEKITKNNPFQRKRVKSSSTVYSLLREDLKQGCVIPPIVLALSKSYEDAKTGDTYNKILLKSLIYDNIEQAHILDGLQRTYNIIDANDELSKIGDPKKLQSYHNNKIRCEFYLGIDKIGILYRMLSLNTGQTPMSLRHQIEILYADYLTYSFDGITFIREIDDKTPRHFGEYSFKEVIEGFTSYLLRDYLTFDRQDILENIKSLEKLSSENKGFDIFSDYIKTYHAFLWKIQDLLSGWEFNDEEDNPRLSAPAFGKDSAAIFNKSQVMTGFGAAIGLLKDKELTNFEKVYSDLDNLIPSNSEWANILIEKLDDIRKYAPKIGNAQREFFYYFFRELFNPKGDAYLNLSITVENAHRRYRQNA